jgi:cytochrome P450
MPDVFKSKRDKTFSAFLTFFLAMAAYPRVQAKAREEVDGLADATKLPTLDDRPILPYVNAIIKELLRWRPPIPLGKGCLSSFVRSLIADKVFPVG